MTNKTCEGCGHAGPTVRRGVCAACKRESKGGAKRTVPGPKRHPNNIDTTQSDWIPPTMRRVTKSEGAPPAKPACEQCKFFVTGFEVVGVGECRRFPPHVFFNPAREGYSSGFPVVKPEQWCGEFVKETKS